MAAANDQVGNVNLCKPLGIADTDLCSPYLPRESQTTRQLPRSTRVAHTGKGVVRAVRPVSRAVKRDLAEVNSIGDETEQSEYRSYKVTTLERTLRKIERLLTKVEREAAQQQEY